MNTPERVYLVEVDLIRIAMIASDNRARRESWHLIAAILVMGICFLTVFLWRVQ
jgi:hypothetical protein